MIEPFFLLLAWILKDESSFYFPFTILLYLTFCIDQSRKKSCSAVVLVHPESMDGHEIEGDIINSIHYLASHPMEWILCFKAELVWCIFCMICIRCSCLMSPFYLSSKKRSKVNDHSSPSSLQVQFYIYDRRYRVGFDLMVVKIYVGRSTNSL